MSNLLRPVTDKERDFEEGYIVHKKVSNIIMDYDQFASIPACNKNRYLYETSPAYVADGWEHVTCKSCLRSKPK